MKAKCLFCEQHVINNLTTLGAKVSAFGVVGEDLNGNKLQKELEKEG